MDRLRNVVDRLRIAVDRLPACWGNMVDPRVTIDLLREFQDFAEGL